ncbi:RteC domain-containing protein [Aureibaculum sp. A20]|uniref:RteC domain-containing protein n=1 Tax=Aureibaculum flavum TaxID=2795986 RepID=A0ABS0WNV0_9FLAO|nr:RteC domain-containing protein [Aureibaculum flavum]MBJ2173639.1 RteC domain-containing protein [Aureibaculum flavum]
MEFEKLLQKLHVELNKIAKEHTDIIKQSSLSIVLCRGILHEMHQMILQSSFNNESDEVNFFKRIKVIPLSQLIYSSEIKSFELHFPKLGKKKQERYLTKEIDLVNTFFNYHFEFVQYFKEGNTHSDILYFTRSHYNDLPVINRGNYYCPPKFCTSRDTLLSKLISFDRFAVYLQNRLMRLSIPLTLNTNTTVKNSGLTWTSSKVALTELVYALHSCGAINSGAANIKDIVALTETIFNVELGDYYRTFLDIKMRKTGRTMFLEKLKESLLKKMDDYDA